MELWGLKTEAAFDVWSIEHLVMGITLAFFAEIITKRLVKKEKISKSLKLKISFITVLSIALLWENVEHYIEVGLLGNRVEYWFQGVEHWTNRIFFDNLMVMLGWYIYTKEDKLAWFARIFSIIWLFFHIFIFPHSMYLHKIL